LKRLDLIGSIKNGAGIMDYQPPLGEGEFHGPIQVRIGWRIGGGEASALVASVPIPIGSIPIGSISICSISIDVRVRRGRRRLQGRRGYHAFGNGPDSRIVNGPA